MMEDWTDIFADGLKDVEAPLPEGDWDVLQKRYDAVQRRRRTAVWRWLGAATSAAAVLAVVFLLFRTTPQDVPQYSNDDRPVQQDSSLSGTSVEPGGKGSDMTAEAVDPLHGISRSPDVPELSERSESSESPEARKPQDVFEEPLVPDTDTVEVFDVVKDTETPDVEKLIVDSSMPAEKKYWNEDDFADDMPRRRIRVSVGSSASGGLGGGNVIPRMMSPMEPVDPSDTTVTEVRTFSPSESMTKAYSVAGRTLKDTDFQHYMPVSFGVSARFGLSDSFSISTGLNYTMYASRRTRTYFGGFVENDMQKVHYLGIPLRCDWRIMDKSNLDMYLGLGGQVDKCIYAKAGSERLHEKEFLWSAGLSLGLQYGISDRASLFVEPEVSAKINRGSLSTYRNKHDLMLTARLGFRIDL